MGNWYEVLGTTSNADHEQIKSAFRNLAKAFHPDLNAGDKKAEERFKKVKQAYEVLRDPQARATYDTYLANKRSGARRRFKKMIATTSAAFVLSGASSFFFIIWLQTERVPLAHDHATARLSENVPVVSIPRFVSGAGGAASRQGGDAGMATASSAQTGATQELREDAQTTNNRRVQARWIAYPRGRTPQVSNVAQSARLVDARLKAEGMSKRSSARAEREQAARMLKKAKNFSLRAMS